MDEAARVTEPRTIAKLVLAITRGVAAGWVADTPQVLVTQAEGLLVGARQGADIGPRFIARALVYRWLREKW